MDEKEYLNKLKRKDESALAWFIDRYAAYVNTIIYSIIGSSMSAEDMEEVASDVFFTFWCNAGQVRHGKVKAYLSGVARNKAKEYTRKIKKEVTLEDDLLIISDENLEKGAEMRELSKYLKETILELPYPDREIFLRYYYYYQPVAEIAQEMDMNVSTIKTKLRRGRDKLREIISKGGYIIESENF